MWFWKAKIPELFVVIKSKDPRYAYYFSGLVKGCDKTALQEVIIEGGNPEFACYFARYNEDADIKRLEDVVIKSRDFKYACYFARYVKGADVERLQREFSDLGDVRKTIFQEKIQVTTDLSFGDYLPKE